MRRASLAILCLLLHFTTAQAESLQSLINTGGSLTGGSGTYSNFSGSLTVAPTLASCDNVFSVLPCATITTSLSTINVQTTETGVEISGIQVSGVSQGPVNPEVHVTMGYDVSMPLPVAAMSTDVRGDGSFRILANTVTAERLNGDFIGVASTAFQGLGCPALSFCTPRIVGPVPINASTFHVTEDIVAVQDIASCSLGPPGEIGPRCGFGISVAASATFSTVPEPGTGLLALTGLIGFGLVRRVINKK
jgi:hypothetical protein